MGSEIEVREAMPADRSVLLGFHRGLYQTHRDQVVAPEILPLIEYENYPQVLENDIDALLRDKDSCVLIAEANGVRIGYVSGRIQVEPQRTLPKRGVVEDWYVEPLHRSRGVGTRLLDALEARFRSAGCQVVESATWSSNDRARSAHTGRGFHEVRIMYRKRL